MKITVFKSDILVFIDCTATPHDLEIPVTFLKSQSFLNNPCPA